MVISPTSFTESMGSRIRDHGQELRDAAREAQQKENFERQVERRQQSEAMVQRNREANVQRSRDIFDKSIKEFSDKELAYDQADHMVRAVIRNRADERHLTERAEDKHLDRQRDQAALIDEKGRETRERKVEQDIQADAIRRKLREMYTDQRDVRDNHDKQSEFDANSAREKQKAADAYRDENNRDRSSVDRTMELVV